MKKVAIVGATGYTGQELVRLLLQHDKVQIVAGTSHSYTGQKFSSVYPSALKFADFACSDDDLDNLSKKVDVIFVALPHGQAAAKVTEAMLERCRIIDLGADFRLRDPAAYKHWYGLDHATPSLLKHAVYGLPELNRKDIVNARLIANPGCYATCSLLTLAPLLKKGVIGPASIVVDAKSGVSGAGRALDLGVHFDECNESIKAYKVASHRHTPEIEQVLTETANHGNELKLTFTPHLVPMNRGILITAYGSLRSSHSQADLISCYEEFFAGEHFVRIFGPANTSYPYPETRWVKGSNFFDVGVTVDNRTDRVVAIGALDNLVKGAAGQAIQNMNIVLGFDEQTGLNQMPIFPA